MGTTSPEPASDRPAWAGLGFAFVALVCLVRPWTLDFPTNDDWAYLAPVKRLAADGVLRLTDWASPTQVLHVAWGAIWAKLAGWDIGLLKLSNLLWFGAGAAILLRLLLRQRVPRGLALLAALTYLLNPIGLAQATSFMTDVPYATLVLASMAAFAEALQRRSRAWAVLGGIAAAAAFLVRQCGLLLPLGYTAVLLYREGRRRTCWRHLLLDCWGPVVATAILHGVWFRYVHGPTLASQQYLFGDTLSRLASPGQLVSDTLFRVTGAWVYLGLFTFPVAAGTVLGLATGQRSATGGPARPHLPRSAKALAMVVLAAGVMLCCRSGSLPFLRNIIEPNGLGPMTLAHPELRPGAALYQPPFWWLLTGLSLVAAYVLALLTLQAIGADTRPDRTVVWMLFVTLLAQLGVSLAGARYFDRYLLPPLPLALALAVQGARPEDTCRGVAWGLWAVAAALSLVSVMDNLAWNRAKWELGRRAVDHGIPAEQVGGGLDWDAFWNYGSAMEMLRSKKALIEIGEWEWRSQRAVAAFLTFEPASRSPGAELCDLEPYFTPIGMTAGAVYLYRFPAAWAVNRQAELLERQGRLRAAELRYRRLARLAPADAAPRYRLGVLLQRQGRAAEAATWFDQAASLAVKPLPQPGPLPVPKRPAAAR